MRRRTEALLVDTALGFICETNVHDDDRITIIEAMKWFLVKSWEIRQGESSEYGRIMVGEVLTECVSFLFSICFQVVIGNNTVEALVNKE